MQPLTGMASSNENNHRIKPVMTGRHYIRVKLMPLEMQSYF